MMVYLEGKILSAILVGHHSHSGSRCIISYGCGFLGLEYRGFTYLPPRKWKNNQYMRGALRSSQT